MSIDQIIDKIDKVRATGDARLVAGVDEVVQHLDSVLKNDPDAPKVPGLFRGVSTYRQIYDRCTDKAIAAELGQSSMPLGDAIGLLGTVMNLKMEFQRALHKVGYRHPALGGCQDSCRLKGLHAACCSGVDSEVGFSHTSPTWPQFRVAPDHRFGLRA